jgi:hypothetical protein
MQVRITKSRKEVECIAACYDVYFSIPFQSLDQGVCSCGMAKPFSANTVDQDWLGHDLRVPKENKVFNP